MESFYQLSEEKEDKVSPISDMKIISHGQVVLPSGFSSTFWSIPSQKTNDENIITNNRCIVEDMSKTITEEDDDFMALNNEQKVDPKDICKAEKPQDNPDILENDMMRDFSIHDGEPLTGSRFNLRIDDSLREGSPHSEDSVGMYLHGRWSSEEHKKFMEALLIYGNEWKKVQQHIKTRSSTQARSHAQKFFIRLKKSIFENGNDKPSKEKIISLFRETLHREIRPKDIEKFVETMMNLANSNGGFKQKRKRNETVSNLTNYGGNNPATVNMSNESLCDSESDMTFLKSSSHTKENEENKSKVNKIIIRNPINIPIEKEESKVVLEKMLFSRNESLINEDEMLFKNDTDMERFKSELAGEVHREKDFDDTGIGEIQNLSCIIPLPKQNIKNRVKQTARAQDKIFLIEKVERASGSDHSVKKSKSNHVIHIPPSAQQHEINTQSMPSQIKRDPINSNPTTAKINTSTSTNSNILEGLKPDFIPNFLINTNPPSSSHIENNQHQGNTWEMTFQRNNMNNTLGNWFASSASGAMQNNSSQYFNPKVNSFVNIVTINLLNEMNKEQANNSNATKTKGGKATNKNFKKTITHPKEKSINQFNEGKFIENLNENNLSTMYERMTSEQQEIFKMILQYQLLLRQSQMQNNNSNNNNNSATTHANQNRKSSNRITVPKTEKMIQNSNVSNFNNIPIQQTCGNSNSKISQIPATSEFEMNSKNPFNLDFNQSFFRSSFANEMEDLLPLNFGNSSGQHSQNIQSRYTGANNNITNSLNENNPLQDFDPVTNFDLEKYFN